MIRIEYTLNGKVESRELEDGSYIAGRRDTCDLVLKDPSVSGQHARLDVSGGTLQFRDLLSKNGTKLNGAKVEHGELGPGDTLTLGKVDLRAAFTGVPLDFSAPAVGVHEESTPAAAPIQAIPPVMPPVGQAAPAAVASSSGAMPRAASGSVPSPAFLGGGLEMVDDVPAQLPSVLPATREAAVVLVRPPESAAPAKKVKPLYLVAGAVIVVLLALLALAPDDTGKTKTVEKKGLSAESYITKATEAVTPFRNRDYVAAHRTWAGLDEEWKTAHPAGPAMELAGFLKRVAEPFALAVSGGKLPDVDWRGLYNEHLDMDERNRFPIGMRDFVEELELLLRLEAQQQDIFRQGTELFQKGRFDEAKAKYETVSSQSIYFTRVPEAIAACVGARVAELRQNATLAFQHENYAEAVKLGQEAQRLTPDEKFEMDLNRWQVFLSVQTDLDKVNELLKSKKYQDIKTAEGILNRLNKEQGTNPLVTRRLPEYRNTVDKALYLRRLGELYAAGDSEGVIKLHENPTLGKLPEATQIFSVFEQVYAAFGLAEKALEEKDYRGARKLWMSVLSLESEPENAYHKRALGKLAEWPRERIGEMERTAAMNLFSDGKYRMAREKLDFVQRECGIDVAKEVEALAEQGKRLYNQGINDWHNNLYGQGTLELFEARDHFLPTEPWYKTINDRIIQLRIKDPRPKP